MHIKIKTFPFNCSDQRKCQLYDVTPTGYGLKLINLCCAQPLMCSLRDEPCWTGLPNDVVLFDFRF